jgi:hypothetical protein
MKVKLHTISAGPGGCADAGEPVTLSEGEGKRLIAAGAAQPHTAPLVSEARPSTLVEEQARKREETRLQDEADREASAKSLTSITAALNALDQSEDDDWTSGGKPAMDRLKMLTGSTTLTRAEVDALASEFKRPTEAETAGTGVDPVIQPAAATSGPRSNKP